MRSKKIQSNTIINVGIIKDIITNIITSLNIPSEEVDIEEDIEDINHIKPVLTFDFGTVYKFKLTVYKRSSFEEHSFDYTISVESEEVDNEDKRPSFYNNFHTDANNIADTKGELSKDIKGFILSYMEKKQGELLVKLNEKTNIKWLFNKNKFYKNIKTIESILDEYNFVFEKIKDDGDGIHVVKYLMDTEFGKHTITFFTDDEYSGISGGIFDDDNDKVFAHFEIEDISDENINNAVRNMIKEYGMKNSHKVAKYIMKMNEYMDYQDIIMNDKNFLDKEDDLIKLYRDQIKEYDQKKNNLKNIFENIEDEIDNGFILRTIDDNVFIKQYITLLTKLREKLILEKSLEQKQEVLDALKNESDLTENQKELSEKEKEIRDIEGNLRKLDNLDIMFNKWEANMSKIERDLKNGKPLSISMLDIVN